MISERKKYIIEIFLKKCTTQNIMKQHIEFTFKLLKNLYPISEDKEKKLKAKYNFNTYTERIAPLIDEYFTIEELQESITFFSSGAGKKIIDPSFLIRIDKIGSRMDSEIEQNFALANDRY